MFKFQHQLNWLGSCQPTTYPIFCHRRVHGVHMMLLTYARIFYYLALFQRKFTFGHTKDLNSSLNPGVGARNHGAKVTRFGATDLDAEVPDRALQEILGGVDMAGTSEPQILTPNSVPRYVAPTSEPWISAPWLQARNHGS